MYILADIGGTKMRFAASADLESFGEPVIVDTPAAYEDGLALAQKIARELASGRAIEALSLGLPGVIVPAAQALHDSNMPAWDGRPIIQDLARGLGTTVHAANDTALV